MAKICWYFQIHQPWRIRDVDVFDVGKRSEYFAVEPKAKQNNEKIMKKVAEKSYRPMLLLLQKLITKHKRFKFALSITGVAIEQMKTYTPDLLEILKELIKSGQVEVLAETYYHSLSSLYSPAEFISQVSKHTRLVQDLFGVTPQVFRNTELIYSNKIAEMVQHMGYKGMLAEGADRILKGRTPTLVYYSPSGLPLLLKHYMLSDDIAFRFSQSSKSEKPLTAETFSHWISNAFGEDEVVNLFMDFETFGEHQWKDTGIFDFFENLVAIALKDKNIFVTPSEALQVSPQDLFESESPVSWADVDRDITAWKGNPLQEDALTVIYSLEGEILKSGDEILVEDWRRLQTSDHFYYMCTKWANDGDVHAYFSPYGSPYKAYINYNNVLSDLKWRLNQRKING